MVTIQDIRPRVITILAKISGIPIEQITDQSSFEELDLDSLSRIEVLVELEREFGIESPEDEEDDEELLQRIQSVEDAARLVEGNLAAQTQTAS